MSDRVDAHMRNRRDIDVRFSDVAAKIQRLEQKLKRRKHDAASTTPSRGAVDPRGSLMDPSMMLLSKLEADLEYTVLEGRILNEQRSERASMCSAMEDAIHNEEQLWQSSQERKVLADTSLLFHECATVETALRNEENKQLESQSQAEAAEKERHEAKKARVERLQSLQKRLADEEHGLQIAESDMRDVASQLSHVQNEKADWERKLREDFASRSQSDLQNRSPKNKLESERRELENHRDALREELRKTEKLSYALRQNEAESLRDPSQAMITSGSRPESNETEAMIWDATRPVRNVLSLRDTILILKARLLNLYDDLDEISETVDSVRGDPQYSMYAAFSEQSNQWRQQKLYDAFHDAVQLMRNRHYEEDGAAANALLRQLKYFVVVYDLFENHYDAVVNAIMLSDGKWCEADEMLEASQRCRRVIQSEQRRPSSIKRRSVSSATINNPERNVAGVAGGGLLSRSGSIRK
jgi:hypothetical protein